MIYMDRLILCDTEGCFGASITECHSCNAPIGYCQCGCIAIECACPAETTYSIMMIWLDSGMVATVSTHISRQEASSRMASITTVQWKNFEFWLEVSE